MTIDRLSAHDLLQLRAALKLSQADLGNWLGVSVMSISRWERGKCKPTGANEVLLYALVSVLQGAEKPDVLRLSKVIKNPYELLVQNDAVGPMLENKGIRRALSTDMGVLVVAGLYALLKK